MEHKEIEKFIMSSNYHKDVLNDINNLLEDNIDSLINNICILVKEQKLTIDEYFNSDENYGDCYMIVLYKSNGNTLEEFIEYCADSNIYVKYKVLLEALEFLEKRGKQ